MLWQNQWNAETKFWLKTLLLRFHSAGDIWWWLPFTGEWHSVSSSLVVTSFSWMVTKTVLGDPFLFPFSDGGDIFCDPLRPGVSGGFKKRSAEPLACCCWHKSDKFCKGIRSGVVPPIGWLDNLKKSSTNIFYYNGTWCRLFQRSKKYVTLESTRTTNLKATTAMWKLLSSFAKSANTSTVFYDLYKNL